MKIEFVAFYPKPNSIKSKKLIGTCHVYLCQPYNMDIKGIRVLKSAKTFFYSLPGEWVYDEETKKPVYYPFIAFTDDKIIQEIIDFLTLEGSKQVAKELLALKANKIE